MKPAALAFGSVLLAIALITGATYEQAERARAIAAACRKSADPSTSAAVH